MRYSDVTLMDKDKGRPASDFRTSQSTFVEADNDSIMKGLEYRTASLTRVPHQHQEYTQVLRYGETEKYSAHLDWFDRKMYLQDPHTLRLIDNGKKNRLVTVFWYLSGKKSFGVYCCVSTTYFTLLLVNLKRSSHIEIHVYFCPKTSKMLKREVILSSLDLGRNHNHIT